MKETIEGQQISSIICHYLGLIIVPSTGRDLSRKKLQQGTELYTIHYAIQGILYGH